MRHIGSIFKTRCSRYLCKPLRNHETPQKHFVQQLPLKLFIGSHRRFKYPLTILVHSNAMEQNKKGQD